MIGHRLLENSAEIAQIQESTRNFFGRLRTVLDFWKAQESNPTVGKLLESFEACGISKMAIEKKYRELPAELP